MHNMNPPFEITNAILDVVAEIAELVGQVNTVSGLTTNPMRHRTNRIRIIYSSCLGAVSTICAICVPLSCFCRVLT